MNSLERVRACVGFEETDRVPVIPQVFGHAAMMEGVPLDAYVQDGELIARCQTDALDRYGYDAVFTVMDVSVEAEALGASLRYLTKAYPVIETRPLAAADDWSTFPLPDPDRAGRMPEMLKALKILRTTSATRFLIVGCVMGPLTLAAQLLGAEKRSTWPSTSPSGLAACSTFRRKWSSGSALAQIDSGAHLPLVFDPFASPAVIPRPALPGVRASPS